MATKSYKNHNGIVSITGFAQESRERIDHWIRMSEKEKKCKHCCLNCEYYKECKDDRRNKG